MNKLIFPSIKTFQNKSSAKNKQLLDQMFNDFWWLCNKKAVHLYLASPCNGDQLLHSKDWFIQSVFYNVLSHFEFVPSKPQCITTYFFKVAYLYLQQFLQSTPAYKDSNFCFYRVATFYNRFMKWRELEGIAYVVETIQRTIHLHLRGFA